MKILLASKSPRRKELLENLGYEFEVVSIECDEHFPEDLKAEDVPSFLSELKASHFGEIAEDEVLITSDTVVVLEHEILGKPINFNDAKAMLHKLSGKTHQVITAVTIKSKKSKVTKSDTAEVEFAEISEEEINHYLENFRPYDKAGSYGIQEWLGMAKIKNINGSFYTIMGLPTHIVYEELRNRDN